MTDHLLNRLEDDIILGTGADFRKAFANTLVTLGIATDKTKDAVSNTDAFFAAQSKRVADIIKAFGSGTGLSDADRESALKAAGGDATVNKQAIQRILRISKQQAEWARLNHNKSVNRIMARYSQDQKDTLLFSDDYIADPLNFNDEDFINHLNNQ